MYQIKIVWSEGYDTLQNKVNRFLREKGEKLSLVDIKFLVQKDRPFAMIIYEGVD